MKFLLFLSVFATLAANAGEIGTNGFSAYVSVKPKIRIHPNFIEILEKTERQEEINMNGKTHVCVVSTEEGQLVPYEMSNGKLLIYGKGADEGSYALAYDRVGKKSDSLLGMWVADSTDEEEGVTEEYTLSITENSMLIEQDCFFKGEE